MLIKPLLVTRTMLLHNVVFRGKALLRHHLEDTKLHFEVPGDELAISC